MSSFNGFSIIITHPTEAKIRQKKKALNSSATANSSKLVHDCSLLLKGVIELFTKGAVKQPKNTQSCLTSGKCDLSDYLNVESLHINCFSFHFFFYSKIENDIRGLIGSFNVSVNILSKWAHASLTPHCESLKTG